MRALEPEGVRYRLGRHRALDPGPKRDPSAGLSSPTGLGPGLLRGDVGAPGDGLQLGG